AGAFGVTGAAAGAIGAGAAAAAVVSWSMASDQMGKLEQETGLSLGRVIENLAGGVLNMTGSFQQLFGAGDRMQNINAIIHRIGDDAQNVNATDEAMHHYIESLERSGQAAVEAGGMTRDAYRKGLAQG